MKAVQIQNILQADYKIFIDTCSLMEPTIWPFIPAILIPYLNKARASVVVPLRVIDELRKLQGKGGEAGAQAASGLISVAQMLSTGVLELAGNESDTFADNYFLYTFIKLRLKHNLALITQDKKLAMDIQDLGNHRSVQGQKKILLLKVENGDLTEWNFKDNKIAEPVEKACFEICTQPRKSRAFNIKLNRVPAAGEIIYSKKHGELLLGDQIAKTESGDIFLCPNGLACKIYSLENLTTFQQQKLDKMLEVKVQIQGVCWPLDVVQNKEGKFVGYLMPMFTGKSLKEAVFSKKSLEAYFPDWTRLDLVDLSLTWLKTVKQLHDINVLLGDVNPSHIFVKNPQEVFIIETDLCQVEDYPCLKTDMDYLAPELRGTKPGTYLQTKEQEWYALTTLLFITLLPGKHPFSCYNGVLAAKIRSLEFPYPIGEKTSRNTPGKPWRYIWSNLTYKVKEMFFNVFSEEEHISPEMWLKVIYEYRRLLNTGVVNNEVFPEKHKIMNPCEVTCTRCGIKEIQEKKWVQTFIITEGKKYYCEKCLADMRRDGKREAYVNHHNHKGA